MWVCVCVGVCGCGWVAHTSKVKTKKLRFFRIFGDPLFYVLCFVNAQFK